MTIVLCIISVVSLCLNLYLILFAFQVSDDENKWKVKCEVLSAKVKELESFTADDLQDYKQPPEQI